MSQNRQVATRKKGRKMREPIGHADLAAAIVLLAMADYKKALREEKRAKTKKEQDKVKKLKRDCESFFKSEWGELLTLGHGVELMMRCRREVEEEEKKE
jgi:hypothetical protein